MILAENYSFSYPDGTEALRNINVSIGDGEFAAFIGQNGSGKTTFAKSLARLLKGKSGNILVDGADINSIARKELSKKIGYVFQNPDHQLFSSSVKREIESGPGNLGLPADEVKSRLEEAARIAGVPEKVFTSHSFFLPKGMRQRIAIASVLAMKPRTIIVDEPTTGQDRRQSVTVMNFLKKLNEDTGCAVIIITHDIQIVAEYARRVILFRDGGIILDEETHKAFSKPEILEKARVKPPQTAVFSKTVFGEICITPGEFLEKFGGTFKGS